MPKTWHKVLLSLGISFLMFAVYAWFFGYQTLMVLETRWVASKAPVVKLIPKALPATEVSNEQGTRLSSFGYEFEVPWDDLDDAKTKQRTHSVALSFRSGKQMLIMRSGPREGVNTLLEHSDKDSFRKLYGDAAFNSDYVLWTTIFNATPSKVTFFTSSQECTRISVILLIKAIAAPEDSGLYAVQTKDFKGFQWGDPEKHPHRIVVSLFADDGGMEFSFWPPRGQHELAISQAEINRVLQTLTKDVKSSGSAQSEDAAKLIAAH